MFRRLSSVAIVVSVMFILAGRAAAVGSGAFRVELPDAEGLAMGAAFVGEADNASAVYYNPAGLASISNSQLGAMHTEWIDDIRYEFAAGAFGMREGVFGVSATLLTMGEMEGRTATGEKTDNFGAYDFALQCSYGKSLGDKRLAGISLKYIRQSIEEELSNGVAVDLGLQRKLTNNLNLGLNLRNLGPNMKFIEESYNLPLSMGLGAGLNFGGVTLALDTNYEIIDRNMELSFGTEYAPIRFIALRGGYLISALKNTSNNNMGEVFKTKDGLSGGMGINVLNYSLDYAVVPYSDLGTTQRLSFLIGF